MTTMPSEPYLIEGGMAVDDRGSLSFVNGFEFTGVKRFYIVDNHVAGFVRAWHGHRFEAKYMFCSRGSMLVGTVKIDNWESPPPDLPASRFVLSEKRPQILYVPPGYANGLMSLTPDAEVFIFSTSTIDDARGDDIRFPARYWNIWEVEER